jgi:YHS domain-containing protein
MATDPICGMTIDETTARHEARDGKTIYFCSEGCRQKFLAQAQPEAKAACCLADSTAPVKSAAKHFCPMYGGGKLVSGNPAVPGSRVGQIRSICQSVYACSINRVRIIED